MSAPDLIVPLVLLAALLHASWNALVKSSGDRLVVLTAVNFTGLVIGACLIPWLPLPAPEAWPYLIASAVFHTAYYAFLLKAYRHGDLSQVYPLARGTAPLLITVGGFLFAGEGLSLLMLAGIMLASVGIISLSFEHGSPFRGAHPAVVPALLTSFWIAAYSVTDGLGGRVSGNVLSYICWLTFLDGWPILIYTLWVRRGRALQYLRENWRYSTAGGIFSLSAYGVVIYAMSLGAMGLVSALRETSVIMASIIGIVMLKERVTPLRIGSALLVTTGVVLMRL